MYSARAANAVSSSPRFFAELIADWVARGRVLLVETELLDALLDQAQRIVLIVDREVSRVFVIEFLDVLAQDANAETVKCRDQRQAGTLLCVASLHALTHLFRGFVRERDREDVPARNVLLGMR